jgi:hypothetical protein
MLVSTHSLAAAVTTASTSITTTTTSITEHKSVTRRRHQLLKVSNLSYVNTFDWFISFVYNCVCRLFFDCETNTRTEKILRCIVYCVLCCCNFFSDKKRKEERKQPSISSGSLRWVISPPLPLSYFGLWLSLLRSLMLENSWSLWQCQFSFFWFILKTKSIW